MSETETTRDGDAADLKIQPICQICCQSLNGVKFYSGHPDDAVDESTAILNPI